MTIVFCLLLLLLYVVALIFLLVLVVKTVNSKSRMLPVLALRDFVMFPKMIAPLFVGRESSIKALEWSGKCENKVVLVAQKEPNKDDPKAHDVFKVGVIANVLQVLRLQNANIKILVEGLHKVKLTKIVPHEHGFLQTYTKIIKETSHDSSHELDVLQRAVREQFEEYVAMNKRLNPTLISHIVQISDVLSFCDSIGAHLSLPVEKKQKLLEIDDGQKKLEELLVLISSEVEFLKAEDRIKNRVRTQIEKNQKDYYLHEQLKAIHKELGEDEDEFDVLANKIKELKLSDEVRAKANSELKKLRAMNPMSSEANVVRNYLDWLLELPWNEYSDTIQDLQKAQDILDAEHHGLHEAKERIIEYLAVNMRTNKLAGPIICFVGPPGVGKTSLARSIANATGRKFVKISLGGLRDEAEIRGHRRTYIGALPGKIIQAVKKSGVSNPLLLLDEIDKLSHDFRGDPAAALLEVLDPEQNCLFSDHFLEVEYDLSHVMFVTTANTTHFDRPLLDRMEVIRLSGYTEEEKVGIAKNHLILKQQQLHGIRQDELTIHDSAIKEIIRYYTCEAGVRNLEREIAKIIRKVVKKILVEDVKSFVVESANLQSLLGVRKFDHLAVNSSDLVGTVNGLAYTEVGGDLLSIETLLMPGKGELKITGKLGDVMKESIQAATSYIRSRAAALGITEETIKNKDVHVHVPEGAVPKDGPSAGISICTAIVSSMTSIPVRHDVAMTGEITLRGRVLGIGGLKEKLLAAVRGGVRTVIVPKENEKDLAEMPQNVKEAVKIIPVDDINEVFDIALTSRFQPIKWASDKDVQQQEHRYLRGVSTPSEVVTN